MLTQQPGGGYIKFSTLNAIYWVLHTVFIVSYFYYIILYSSLNFDPSEVWTSFTWWTYTISLAAIAMPITTIFLISYRRSYILYSLDTIIFGCFTAWFFGMALLAYSYYVNNCQNINICRNPDCVVVPSPTCGPVYHGADKNFIISAWLFVGYGVFAFVELMFGIQLRRRVLAADIASQSVTPNAVASNSSAYTLNSESELGAVSIDFSQKRVNEPIKYD
jgi:hypothetical protein